MIHVLLMVLSAYITADFVTGFFHWLEDTYGNKSWGSWLYKAVVLPNIEHHNNPRKFTQSSYWERTELSWYLAFPFIFVGLSTGHWWFALFGLFALNANEVHCWAHRRDNNPAIRFLQFAHVVQNTKHHGIHHRPPYEKRYCVMSPWVNPVLDGLRFWRGLELVLGSVGIRGRYQEFSEEGI